MFGINSLRQPVRRMMAALGIIGAALVLGACSGVDPIVSPEKRIPFNVGGAHSGQWRDLDAAVWYRYTTDGVPAGKIQMSGGVSARLRVDQLSVFVRFLDGGGRILGSARIYSGDYRKGEVGGEFSRTVDLPPQAEALSFASFSRHDQGHR